MKRIFLSLSFLACLFLAVNVQAQQKDQSSQSVVIIKTSDKDGNTTIKKKRLDNGQSIKEYVESLDIEDSPDINVIISHNGNEEADKTENLFFFKSTDGKKIEINGSGDWQEALHEMKFNFDINDFHDHHDVVYEVKDQNKALLGVYPENGDNGVKIDGIVSGSGAEKAGLKENDVMIAINGITIVSKDDLHVELGQYEPGDVITVDVQRDGNVMTISSQLTARGTTLHRSSYRDPCKVFYGVYVGSYGNGKEGVGVAGIVGGNDWPAEVAGLRKGDRILAIDGIPIGNHRELVTERDKHEPGEAFSFTYLRDGEIYEVDARFKSCPKDEVEVPVEEEIEVDETQLEFTDNALELEEFNAYPNPTFGNLNVKFRGEAVPTTVRIVDINGKVVHEENIKNFDGHYNRQLDISDGALGTMILSVTQNGKSMAKSVVLINRA